MFGKICVFFCFVLFLLQVALWCIVKKHEVVLLMDWGYLSLQYVVYKFIHVLKLRNKYGVRCSSYQQVVEHAMEVMLFFMNYSRSESESNVFLWKRFLSYWRSVRCNVFWSYVSLLNMKRINLGFMSNMFSVQDFTYSGQCWDDVWSSKWSHLCWQSRNCGSNHLGKHHPLSYSWR